MLKSTDLADDLSITTLNEGNDLTAMMTGGVKINDANVEVADIMATNGIIHVIDTVLLPPPPPATTPAPLSTTTGS